MAPKSKANARQEPVGKEPPARKVPPGDLPRDDTLIEIVKMRMKPLPDEPVWVQLVKRR